MERYTRLLGKLIESGRAKPSFIVSLDLLLEEAPAACAHFNSRDDGWTKVILKSGQVAQVPASQGKPGSKTAARDVAKTVKDATVEKRGKTANSLQYQHSE